MNNSRLYSKLTTTLDTGAIYTLSFHYAWHAKPDHYDLFIDKGDKLLTFGLNNISTNTVSLVPQQPHRKKYLNYSGKVSKNRGFVSIIVSGIITKRNKRLYRLNGLGDLDTRRNILTLKTVNEL